MICVLINLIFEDIVACLAFGEDVLGNGNKGGLNFLMRDFD